jgi:branched-chain amino acid transport system substrate-binding protein
MPMGALRGFVLGLAGLAATSTAMLAQSGEPFRIGVLTDMSGAAADLSGQGTALSVKMAVEDFGGQVLGRPIQVVEGDHLSKPDQGLALARKWYDEGVNAIFDVGLTSLALAVQELAREKNKTVVFLSSSGSDITGKACSPNGIHWTYNSYAQAYGVVDYVLKQGGKDWYFMTIDYALGRNIQRDVTEMITAAGGSVRGDVRHPWETKDFSSDLLKAQGSGAKVIGLATTTFHAASIIRQADEFGVRPKQNVVALSLTLHDTKAMGLQTAQGLQETSPYYWDQNDETRAFAKRYHERFKRMPNMIQASAYGAVTHYLNAVKAAATDKTEPVIAKMKETPINDFMTKNGSIRVDGRVMRDMVVLEAKKPAESKGEWDLYKVVAEVPRDKAFQPADPAVCPLVK